MNRLRNSTPEYTDNTMILNSLFKLENWLAQNGWKAYDPFDGLGARGAKFITLNNHYLRIALQQAVRRFPLNIRPLLGIRKHTSTKGMGFCALGYLKLYHATLNEEYLEKMQHCLNWLKENYSEGYTGYAWGNNFSYESRGGTIPFNTPTIVWTSLIGNVFFDAFEATGETVYFEIAKSACEFILNDIERHADAEDSICFMYQPGKAKSPTVNRCIHNSNVLGAWLLSRLYSFTGDGAVFSVARKAINYTMKYQRPQGGWWYGEPAKFQWEDNFHTGYNLESIHGFIKATGDKTHKTNLIKAFKYYKSTFFGEDGTPRYYNYKTYPIDIQCASQGIQTLVNLSEYDSGAVELAQKVAIWTIKHLQDPQGYFYFRKYPFVTNRTPMFHWGQATMLSALASYGKEIGELEEYHYKQESSLSIAE